MNNHVGAKVDAQTKLPTTARNIGLRHTQVLDEATRELNTRGVSLTSMADIASRLGISRAAMYTYVTDREDLVFQCCHRSLLLMARYLDESCAEISNSAADQSDSAVQVLTRFIARVLEPHSPPLAARAEIMSVSSQHRQVIHALYAPIVTQLAALLESGAKTGSLRVCDYDVVARTILGLLNWAPLVHPQLTGPSVESHRRLRKTIEDIVLHGLAVDRTAPLQYASIDLAPLQFTINGAFDRDAINAARLEALLLSASRLFNRKGFHATSLQEIMTSVGTTKRTLYRYLADKQTLAATCYDRAFRIFFFIGERMSAYRGTRLQALAATVHALATTYLRDDLTPMAPPVCYAALSPENKLAFDTRSSAVSGGHMQVINAGIAEGSVAAIDADARVKLLPGIFSLLINNDFPADSVYRDQVAREITTLFCIGLRAT